MNRPSDEAPPGEWESLSISERGSSVRISVHVRPKSSRRAVLGVRERSLDIALTSPPADGAANAELQKLLARVLEVGQRDIAIVAGASSRNKVLEVHGVRMSDVRTRLAGARK